nr:hypothetical protein [Xanthomonas translucens]
MARQSTAPSELTHTVYVHDPALLYLSALLHPLDFAVVPMHQPHPDRRRQLAVNLQRVQRPLDARSQPEMRMPKFPWLSSLTQTGNVRRSCLEAMALSPLYNRIVDADRVGADAVAGSTEPRRLELHDDGDRRYAEDFLIGQTPQARHGAGSCIFAQLWRAAGEARAGCTTMEPADMQRLQTWLRPNAAPLFVLQTRKNDEHLRSAWALPATEPAP